MRSERRGRRAPKHVLVAIAIARSAAAARALRDIKTTDRNGPVIGIVRVRDDDELLMMTARGKIQRIAAGDISIIGRNTQGVRIMSLDEGDTLAAIVRVPREEATEAAAKEARRRTKWRRKTKPAASIRTARPTATSSGRIDDDAGRSDLQRNWWQPAAA